MSNIKEAYTSTSKSAAEFWSAAKKGYLNPVAFYTAYFTELNSLGIVKNFYVDPSFCSSTSRLKGFRLFNRKTYGALKSTLEANPTSWAAKAAIEFWVLQFKESAPVIESNSEIPSDTSAVSTSSTPVSSTSPSSIDSKDLLISILGSDKRSILTDKAEQIDVLNDITLLNQETWDVFLNLTNYSTLDKSKYKITDLAFVSNIYCFVSWFLFRVALYCVIIERKELYNEVAAAIVKNNNKYCDMGYDGYRIDKDDVKTCVKFLADSLPKSVDYFYASEITKFMNSFAKDSD